MNNRAQSESAEDVRLLFRVGDVPAHLFFGAGRDGLYCGKTDLLPREGGKHASNAEPRKGADSVFFCRKRAAGRLQTPRRVTFSVKKYMLIEYKNGMVAARKSRKRSGRKRKYR